MAVPLVLIDDSIKQLYTDGIDTIIQLVGKPCKLVIDGEPTNCPNCSFDPASGTSSGAYLPGGPRFFDTPPCPVCKGTGYDPATRDRSVIKTFTIDREARPFELTVPPNLTRPRSYALIKGYVTDLPAVLQARHFILDYGNALYQNDRYVRYREATPSGSIVSGRYFEMYLRRDE